MKLSSVLYSPKLLKELLRATFRGQFRMASKTLAKLAARSPQTLAQDFATIVNGINSAAIQNLAATALQEHPKLAADNSLSYSILVPIYMPELKHLEIALRSALAQSAPHFEVLAGFDGPHPVPYLKLVEKLQAEFSPEKLKAFGFERSAQSGGISRTTNALAGQAKNNYLLLMDHDDWIRPDLLFQYEKTLRSLRQRENAVLYCNEFKIDSNDFILVDSFLRKPLKPQFPYLFLNSICHCLLVPKALWKKTGGLRHETDGAQDFDLCLRLDLNGADFNNVPQFMYAWRAHEKSTAKDVRVKDYATPAGVKALKDYVKNKNLNWQVEASKFPTNYRARPDQMERVQIEAFIPSSRDAGVSKKVVEALQAQQGVSVKIWFLAENEILSATHLNRGSTELVALLQGDVVLQPEALAEMARWLFQAKIGIVGAELKYPNGTLQHGGLDRTLHLGPGGRTEYGLSEAQRLWTRVARVCDAVAPDCILIRKADLLKIIAENPSVNPFTDPWYLSQNLKNRELLSFYTPYARGLRAENAKKISTELSIPADSALAISELSRGGPIDPLSIGG